MSRFLFYTTSSHCGAEMRDSFFPEGGGMACGPGEEHG